MLQIKDIRKEYITGELHQVALDGVSLSFRDNEFVAILGPSGSGKTTLLNVIGGLDRYDSGDLIINQISTKKYDDRDWDSYRNHTIGFVFQSYNLIPHQTVLANVELALTISGIPSSQRRQRAIEALEKVGLGNQLHKKPNQMSGGQMQRVAIARALVNNPDILLADEPTGALDTKTSVQIMDLLKEVAKDRLVVMVTHNPELAEQYATRIVQLKDGNIISDTDPYNPEEEKAEHKNMGRSSMSFLTSLALSFNNLKTKKGRTFLTSFAGSIGIIGIALILSLSNGVNLYIEGIQEDTLSEYPLSIYKTGMDLSSMMGTTTETNDKSSDKKDNDAEVTEMPIISTMFNTTSTNDLKSLKKFIESKDSKIYDYANAVEYNYDVTPYIYRLDSDTSYRKVNPDTTFSSLYSQDSDSTSMVSLMMSMSSAYTSFSALPEDNALYEDQYDVKAGHWPENDLECVVVLSENSKITDLTLYALGLKDSNKLDEILKIASKEVDVDYEDETSTYKYSDFLNIEFKLVDKSACYEYDTENKIYVDKSDNKDFMLKQVKNGETMKIVGVVCPKEDATATMLTTGICYSSSLQKHVMKIAQKSEIAKAQLANKDINVFTGKKFDDEDSSLDLDSLFNIDSDALANAFNIDASSLDLSNMDLSGISTDLSNVNFDMSSLNLDFSKVDFSKLLKNININISANEMGNLFKTILNDYLAQASQDPTSDYSKLLNSISAYFQSDQAKTIIQNGLQKSLEDAMAKVSASGEAVTIVRNILTGFSDYIVQQGIQDVNEIPNALEAYIASGVPQSDINSLSEIIKNNMDYTSISSQVTNDLYAGYQAYAASQGLPDVSSLVSGFITYVQSDKGKETISADIKKVINTDDLSSQLKKALSSVTDSYSDVIQQAIKSMMSQIGTSLTDSITKSMSSMMTSLSSSMSNLFNFDADSLSSLMNFDMDSDSLQEMMMSMMSSSASSYEDNLSALNYADEDDPYSISIYPKDFETKSSIVEILEDYNDRMKKEDQEDKVITYTDTVATLMSSVTDIIDTISYVLIAFVAISLVVSSIMIGIITYISVLERTKEIGILRAIGASKRNISQVFNAETFIIGLLAGILGIVITLLLLIPANAFIHNILNVKNVEAVLPLGSAFILIVLSTILTMIGGLIPSRSAAKKDPVTALRVD